MNVLLLPLAALVIPLAVVSVRRPVASIVALYAATLPVASVVKLSVPLPSPFDTLSSVLGAAAILAGVAHLLLYRKVQLPSLPVAGWLLLLGWALLTALWSIDRGSTRSLLLVAGPLILLMAVVACIRPRAGDFAILRAAVIVSGVLVGAYAMWLILRGVPLPAHGASQRFSIASGPDTNPNILAASLLAPLLLGLESAVRGGRIFLSRRTWRVLGAAGFFLSAVAITFTGSRGGLLAGIAGVAVVLRALWKTPDARRGAARISGLAVVAVAALAAFLLGGRAVSPQSPVGKVLSSDAVSRIVATSNGSSGRLDIWKAGYLACIRHCAIGGGLGTFPVAYDEVFPFTGAEKNTGTDRPAHDIYLQAAVELGVLGLTLLMGTLLLEWRASRSRRVRRHTVALPGILISVLVANIFLSAIWFKYFFLVFIVIRVAESTPMVVRRRAIEPTPVPEPALL